MPALTISTTTRSRSPSPRRPPVSPITPTLGLARTLSHAQPDQVAVPPPGPEPLAFDANPDAIALRSAISILQMQRQRATADIQTLQRAKEAAVEHPAAFIRDLTEGRINTPRAGHEDEDTDGDTGEGSSKQAAHDQPRPWTALPKPQSIVRCPPINWSQYAVVGESLDRLHNEQVTRPTRGTPATIGPGGMFEFKGGEGTQEKYVGVSAPYDPLKDRLDKKGRGKR